MLSIETQIIVAATRLAAAYRDVNDDDHKLIEQQ